MKTRTSSQPYVDANALVYAFFDKTERGATVKKLLRKGGTVSSLAIDEFLWAARKEKQTNYIEYTHELLMHPTLEFIEVHCTTTLRASELMVKYNLKPRDAMHAAIMEEEGATAIISADSDFDKIPGIKRIAV